MPENIQNKIFEKQNDKKYNVYYQATSKEGRRMNILVVDFAASIGGAMTVLNQFYNDAVKNTSNNYTFLLSDHYFRSTDNVSILVLRKEKKWLNRIIFDYFTGRKLVKRIKPDKIISLQNTIIHGVKQYQVLYIHQAIPFQSIKKFSLFKKNERRFAIIQYCIGHEIKKSAKKADEVIVQTKWMERALREKCGIKQNKITIKRPKIDIEIPKEKMRKNTNHFLYPTSNAIYKNNQIVYDAAEILKERGFDDFVVELTIDGASTKHIKRIDRIPHNKLLKKYQESILLFPSYIETVGMPLLEARRSGAIIIASDTEFAREVLSGYRNVFFFSFSSPNELADCMERCIKAKEK